MPKKTKKNGADGTLDPAMQRAFDMDLAQRVLTGKILSDDQKERLENILVDKNFLNNQYWNDFKTQIRKGNNGLKKVDPNSKAMREYDLSIAKTLVLDKLKTYNNGIPRLSDQQNDRYNFICFIGMEGSPYWLDLVEKAKQSLRDEGKEKYIGSFYKPQPNTEAQNKIVNDYCLEPELPQQMLNEQDGEEYDEEEAAEGEPQAEEMSPEEKQALDEAVITAKMKGLSHKKIQKDFQELWPRYKEVDDKKEWDQQYWKDLRKKVEAEIKAAADSVDENKVKEDFKKQLKEKSKNRVNPFRPKKPKKEQPENEQNKKEREVNQEEILDDHRIPAHDEQEVIQPQINNQENNRGINPVNPVVPPQVNIPNQDPNGNPEAQQNGQIYKNEAEWNNLLQNTNDQNIKFDLQLIHDVYLQKELTPEQQTRADAATLEMDDPNQQSYWIMLRENVKDVLHPDVVSRFEEKQNQLREQDANLDENVNVNENELGKDDGNEKGNEAGNENDIDLNNIDVTQNVLGIFGAMQKADNPQKEDNAQPENNANPAPDNKPVNREFDKKMVISHLKGIPLTNEQKARYDEVDWNAAQKQDYWKGIMDEIKTEMNPAALKHFLQTHKNWKVGDIVHLEEPGNLLGGNPNAHGQLQNNGINLNNQINPNNIQNNLNNPNIIQNNQINPNIIQNNQNIPNNIQPNPANMMGNPQNVLNLQNNPNANVNINNLGQNQNNLNQNNQMIQNLNNMQNQMQNQMNQLNNMVNAFQNVNIPQIQPGQNMNPAQLAVYQQQLNQAQQQLNQALQNFNQQNQQMQNQMNQLNPANQNMNPGMNPPGGVIQNNNVIPNMNNNPNNINNNGNNNNNINNNNINNNNNNLNAQNNNFQPRHYYAAEANKMTEEDYKKQLEEGISIDGNVSYNAANMVKKLYTVADRGAIYRTVKGKESGILGTRNYVQAGVGHFKRNSAEYKKMLKDLDKLGDFMENIGGRTHLSQEEVEKFEKLSLAASKSTQAYLDKKKREKDQRKMNNESEFKNEYEESRIKSAEYVQKELDKVRQQMLGGILKEKAEEMQAELQESMEDVEAERQELLTQNLSADQMKEAMGDNIARTLHYSMHMESLKKKGLKIGPGESLKDALDRMQNVTDPTLDEINKIKEHDITKNITATAVTKATGQQPAAISNQDVVKQKKQYLDNQGTRIRRNRQIQEQRRQSNLQQQNLQQNLHQNPGLQ